MLGRLAIILCLLSAQSCCGVFRLLGCGTGVPIVPVSWDSPDEALKTFQAAVGNGDRKVIYEALSGGFKKANGLDVLMVEVGWKKLQEQVFGVHLLGDAEILDESRAPAQVTYTLGVYGYRVEVGFGARPYWDLGVRGEDGKVALLGDYVGKLDDVIDVFEPRKGRISVRIDDPALADYAREDILFVKAGLAWKITSLRQLDSK